MASACFLVAPRNLSVMSSVHHLRKERERERERQVCRHQFGTNSTSSRRTTHAFCASDRSYPAGIKTRQTTSSRLIHPSIYSASAYRIHPYAMCGGEPCTSTWEPISGLFSPGYVFCSRQNICRISCFLLEPVAFAMSRKRGRLDLSSCLDHRRLRLFLNHIANMLMHSIGGRTCEQAKAQERERVSE